MTNAPRMRCIKIFICGGWSIGFHLHNERAQKISPAIQWHPATAFRRRLDRFLASYQDSKKRGLISLLRRRLEVNEKWEGLKGASDEA